MKNLRAGQGVRREAGDASDESAFGRRYPSVAVRAMTRIGHQSGYGGPTGQNAVAPIRQTRQKAVVHRPGREPIDPVVVILCIGLAAELILPWAVIWLSDVFVFDIPAWLPWLVFGVPAALSLLAVLVYLTSRKRSQQPVRAWPPGRQAF
jgi:hypothetical protein